MSIEKEILVYQNLPPNKFRWVMYLCYMQGFFLVANFWTMPSLRMKTERDKIALERAKQKKKSLELAQSEESRREGLATMPGFVADEEVSFTDMFKDLKMRDLFSFRNLLDNLQERPWQAAAFATGSLAVLGSLWLYTTRMVHKIILLPNGRARFIFFSPLPLKQGPVIEMNLKNIACIAPRESEHIHSILKFRDTLGYRLVDKKDGEFLKPELYDQHLGFQRSWYKR